MEIRLPGKLKTKVEKMFNPSSKTKWNVWNKVKPEKSTKIRNKLHGLGKSANILKIQRPGSNPVLEV